MLKLKPWLDERVGNVDHCSAFKPCVAFKPLTFGCCCCGKRNKHKQSTLKQSTQNKMNYRWENPPVADQEESGTTSTGLERPTSRSEVDSSSTVCKTRKDSEPSLAAPSKHQTEDDQDRRDEEEEDYVPYVPVAKRRQAQRQHLSAALKLSGTASTTPSSATHKMGNLSSGVSSSGTRKPGSSISSTRGEVLGGGPQVSLLETATALKASLPEKSELEREAEFEREVFQAQAARKALVTRPQDRPPSGLGEEDPNATPAIHRLPTNWRPPPNIRRLSEERAEHIRNKYNIAVQGDAPPAPVRSFYEMRFPVSIVQHLRDKGIVTPSPIQVQGLPVAFSGRDMIGIAFTGSGKTLAFSLPAVLVALQAELALPLVRGEGPAALILAPSRELARQTFELIQELCSCIKHMAQLRALLCIGGIQVEDMFSGVHIVVATPGRLQDLLNKQRINLENCRYLTIDEADRLLDFGFEDDIRNILSYFKGPRQTLLFSATMPKKIQEFAKTALTDPIIVNVGRAGAASLQITQEVLWVPEKAQKMINLLDALQKTAPPVMIFSERKSDVDDIHEFLLLKRVAAVSIHGGKSQEERNYAVDSFKSGRADILVATDVASKGLDFRVQHVINFDMPKEIEDYVHRIGRTGRSGNEGTATTFVNRDCTEQILLDLKYLLLEARQVVPDFLKNLQDETQKYRLDRSATTTAADGEDGEAGVVMDLECTFCSGLGHRITNCPKLEHQRKMVMGAQRAFHDDKGY